MNQHQKNSKLSVLHNQKKTKNTNKKARNNKHIPKLLTRKYSLNKENN